MSPMQSPLRVYLHRRQALLFLIAILVPCVVLVVLGLRTREQERQLESKRLVEEQQLLTEQTGHSLLSELEKIKLEEVTKAISDRGTTDAVGWKGLVAFVGPIVDGQLRLPWENSSKARKFRELLYEENFASR